MPYKEILVKAVNNSNLLDYDAGSLNNYGGNWFSRGINVRYHLFNLSGKYSSIDRYSTIPYSNFTLLDISYPHIECYSGSSQQRAYCSQAFILKMPESNGQTMRFLGISDWETISGSFSGDNSLMYNLDVWAR
jgi:hypothetical protein